MQFAQTIQTRYFRFYRKIGIVFSLFVILFSMCCVSLSVSATEGESTTTETTTKHEFKDELALESLDDYNTLFGGSLEWFKEHIQSLFDSDYGLRHWIGFSDISSYIFATLPAELYSLLIFLITLLMCFAVFRAFTGGG